LVYISCLLTKLDENADCSRNEAFVLKSASENQRFPGQRDARDNPKYLVGRLGGAAAPPHRAESGCARCRFRTVIHLDAAFVPH